MNNNNDDDDHRETRPLLRTLDAGMLEEREGRREKRGDGALNACSRKTMPKPLRVLQLPAGFLARRFL